MGPRTKTRNINVDHHILAISSELSSYRNTLGAICTHFRTNQDEPGEIFPMDLFGGLLRKW